MNWFIMASCYNWFYPLKSPNSLATACINDCLLLMFQHDSQNEKILKCQNWRGIIQLLCIYETLLYIPSLSLFCLIISINIYVKRTSCPKLMFNLSYLWWYLYLHLMCFFKWSTLHFLNVITQIALSLSSLHSFIKHHSQSELLPVCSYFHFILWYLMTECRKTESHSKAVIYLFYGLWYFVLASKNSKRLVA